MHVRSNSAEMELLQGVSTVSRANRLIHNVWVLNSFAHEVDEMVDKGEIDELVQLLSESTFGSLYYDVARYVRRLVLRDGVP